jgi:succinate-acetate transporter protein
MTLAGVLEFILGNTFTFVVFCSFGALIYKVCHDNMSSDWFKQVASGFLSGRLWPRHTMRQGRITRQIQWTRNFTHHLVLCLLVLSMRNSNRWFSTAFFALFMGFLCFVYLICSFRINCACMIMFLSMTLGFCLMAGTYWLIARGNMDLAEKTQVVSPSLH